MPTTTTSSVSSHRAAPDVGEASPTFEERFLSGRELYGDDFDASQVAAWFADEQHGYAELYGSDPQRHEYGYTALNEYHGFSRLPASARYAHALGFGSNFGDELEPILHQTERLTLLDSSDRYVVDKLKGVSVSYILAQPNGRIALDDASVDLITCFGVLHHIPNVSAVLAEFGRVMTPGGTLLVREPTTTMGDWRYARKGLTARERGIPRHLFRSMVEKGGFVIDSAAPCYFPPWVRLCERFGVATFGNRGATAIDSMFARAFDGWYAYHRSHVAARFAPASLFIRAHRSGPVGAREIAQATP